MKRKEKEKSLNSVRTHLSEHRDLVSKFPMGQVERAAQVMLGKRILICGCGGSAADAQHFAAELVGRFEKERDPYPAIALTTDTSVITALSNDYSFDSVFSRQVNALGARGDVLLGISTSGNSKSVLTAIAAARMQGMITIALTGAGPNALIEYSDYAIEIPSQRVSLIQEMHIMALHMICEVFDNE